MGMSNSRCISFTLGGMFFEYDEEKNKKNIEKHGISFKSAARIFLIMTELNSMMKKIVLKRIDLTQLGICQQVRVLCLPSKIR